LATGPALCYHMHVENRIASLVIDATDAERLARFWAAALGWQLVNRGSYGVSIGVDGGPFEIGFRLVPDGPKRIKNRLHLDIKPVNRDQLAELTGCSPLAPARWTSGREPGTGTSWLTLRATNSACAVPDAASGANTGGPP
jgi:hypothetical protein